MDVYFFGNNNASGDFNVHEYGCEQCSSGYGFGPYMRNSYFIHYIYSGKGIFEAEGVRYELHEGQIFLIFPGQITYYEADKDDPWLYRWISFDGGFVETMLNNAKLSINSPIYTDNGGEAGRALKDMVDMGYTSLYNIMSKFWIFAGTISEKKEKNSPSEEYVKMAKAQIHSHYMEQLTVGNIADNIGIDRSYLCRLFKAFEGISPKEYLIEYRINLAKKFLSETDCSVSDAARMVGYKDSLDFSKIFKAREGVSPANWKKYQIL